VRNMESFIACRPWTNLISRPPIARSDFFPTTPQRVDYELTKPVSTLWEAVEPLSSWARALSEILKSRTQANTPDSGRIAATQRTEGSGPLLLMGSPWI